MVLRRDFLRSAVGGVALLLPGASRALGQRPAGRLEFDSELFHGLPLTTRVALDEVVLGSPPEVIAYLLAAQTQPTTARRETFGRELARLRAAASRAPSSLLRELEQAGRLLDFGLVPDHGVATPLERLLSELGRRSVWREFGSSDALPRLPRAIAEAVTAGDAQRIVLALHNNLSSLAPSALQRESGIWQRADSPPGETVLDVLDLASSMLGRLGSTDLRRAAAVVQSAGRVTSELVDIFQALNRAQNGQSVDASSFDLSGLGAAVAGLAQRLGASDRAATVIRHVGNTVQGALQGGMAGAAGGPVGIVVGAVVGGLTSLFGSLFGGSSRDPTLEALTVIDRRIVQLAEGLQTSFEALGRAISELGEVVVTGFREMRSHLVAIRRSLDDIRRTLRVEFDRVNQGLAALATQQVQRDLMRFRARCEIFGGLHVTRRLEGRNVETSEVSELLVASASSRAHIGTAQSGLATPAILGTQRFVDVVASFPRTTRDLLRNTQGATSRVDVARLVGRLVDVRRGNVSPTRRAPPRGFPEYPFLAGLSEPAYQLVQAMRTGRFRAPGSARDRGGLDADCGRVIVDLAGEVHRAAAGFLQSPEYRGTPARLRPTLEAYDRSRNDARRRLASANVAAPADLYGMSAAVHRSVSSVVSTDLTLRLLRDWCGAFRVHHDAWSVILHPRMTVVLLYVRRKLAREAATQMAALLHNPAVVTLELVRRFFSDMYSSARRGAGASNALVLRRRSEQLAELSAAPSRLLPFSEFASTRNRRNWQAARRTGERILQPLERTRELPRNVDRLMVHLADGLADGLQSSGVGSLRSMTPRFFSTVFLVHVLDLVLAERLQRPRRGRPPSLAQPFFEWALLLAFVLAVSDEVRSTAGQRMSQSTSDAKIFLNSFVHPLSRSRTLAPTVQARAQERGAVPFPDSLGFVWGWDLSPGRLTSTPSSLLRIARELLTTELLMPNPDFFHFSEIFGLMESTRAALPVARDIIRARAATGVEQMLSQALQP